MHYFFGEALTPVEEIAEIAAEKTVPGGTMLSQSGMITLWIGIVAYVGVLIGIGFWSSRKVKGMNDFLVAGRRLPLWMATATLLATWFGAGSSMGVAATVYSDGIGGVLADPFGASISLVLAGIFIVGLLRRLKCLTVTDIVERKYGKWAGVYTSLWMIPVYIGWLGAQMLGIGTILHILTGMDAIWGTLIGAAVVLIYTFAGGMWAVTLTDVVQVSLIVIGLFVIVPGAVFEAGGWSEMTSRAQRGGSVDRHAGMRSTRHRRAGAVRLFGLHLLHRQLDRHGARLHGRAGPDPAFAGEPQREDRSIERRHVRLLLRGDRPRADHDRLRGPHGADQSRHHARIDGGRQPRKSGAAAHGDHHPRQHSSDRADGFPRGADFGDHEFGRQFAAGRVVAALQQRDRFDLAAAQRPEAAGPDPGWPRLP